MATKLGISNMTVKGEFIPVASGVYDLGAPNLTWDNLYLGPNAISIDENDKLKYGSSFIVTGESPITEGGGSGGTGAPGGLNAQIQFNYNGEFSGVPFFYYNHANGRLELQDLPSSSGAFKLLAVDENQEISRAFPALMQTVWGELTTLFSTDFNIPFDDTIPQSTEGQEVMSVAITPKYSGSYLYVEGAGFITANSASHGTAVTLIKAGVTDAIAATEIDIVNAGFIQPFIVKARILAGDNSPQTFSMRAGHSNVSGAVIVDIGGGSSARRFGGAGLTTLTIEERTA